MLISTVFIVATHLINVCYSTRLPLEVYELTPSNNNNNNPAGVTATDLKHKNLEYSTINSPAAASSSSSDSTNYFKQHASSSLNDPHHPPEQVDLKILSSKEHTQTQLSNQLDRRRSRQMLDLLKSHHDLTGNYNKLHTLQMQLPTTTSTTHASGVSGGGNGAASTNVAHHNGKDVRILYQVGDSEDDLPICAPNAVCSKIDLYETPWIERQCRCPSINRAPEIVIHHHHKDSHSHNNHNSEKYHSYYEHTKILHQNKHLLLDAAGFGADKKYDNLHLKKLMHKLGAVYEDDINLPSDYVLHEENSALASNEEGGSLLYSDDINDNAFPHLAMKRQQQQQHLYSNSAHMRHSGHMGHQEKLTYIGGCPSGLGVEDGHTIADKTRHYKLCQPVHRLPVCRHFRDYTWTLTTSAEVNSTEQIVHCRCPKNSVTYLTKREPLDDGNSGYKYLFACSPLTRLRCQRKQPCKLFTVRKRQEFIDEVNINALCQCPKGHHCPSHHTQSGVIAGETFLEDNIQTYSGYCMVND
ncbi:protein giant-lens [Calliphora vicina]|uniref:protein giant-lens n=1 Tax=Calliphora vicina TaxID=7373 RepID=UPI00325B06B9